jgi:hypothetical protein
VDHFDEGKAISGLRAKLQSAKRPDRAAAELRTPSPASRRAMLPQRELRSARWEIRCTPSWRSRTINSATRLGMTATELLEAAVEEYLERHGGKQ